MGVALFASPFQCNSPMEISLKCFKKLVGQIFQKCWYSAPITWGEEKVKILSMDIDTTVAINSHLWEECSQWTYNCERSLFQGLTPMKRVFLMNSGL